MGVADLQENIRVAAFALPLVLLAFAYHEMAHAYVAMFFGDPTPREHGRKTLNPIKHLDPVGTIMLTVSMLLFGFPFGFAVTPVNDSKMRRPRLHGALTSFAGPLVNIIFCAVCAVGLVWAYENVGQDSFTLGNSRVPLIIEVFFFGTVFNAFLAVFNLLPIPPLDGGRIVGSLMNPHMAREWRKLDEYGMFIIIGLVLIGGASFTQFLNSLQRALLGLIGSLTGNPGLEFLDLTPMPVTDEDDHWTWTVPGARAVFTTREGGVSPAPLDSLNVGLHVGDDPDRVFENRRRAAALVDLDPSHVAGVTQVHGADVWLDLNRTDHLPDEVRWDQGPSPIEADALVTTRADVALAVGIADCMPIALVWGDAIAAIHAGWRSLEGGIVEATLAVLRRSAGNAVATSTPHAVIGPALGACCMEVGDDVAARFDASVVIRRPGAPRPFLDTRADAVRRLEAAGCVVEHVDVCTKDDPRCFSHRGDGGEGGRQVLLVRRT